MFMALALVTPWALALAMMLERATTWATWPAVVVPTAECATDQECRATSAGGSLSTRYQNA